MRLLDYAALAAIKIFIVTLNVFPLSWRMKGLAFLIKCVARCLPSYARVSFKNLEMAFPGHERSYYESIYNKSFENLARVLVDFARLHTLDTAWAKAHVQCPFLPRFEELKAESNGTGVLIATGHLGSFELMAHSIALLGHPISFVVRNFKLPAVDAWWTANREKSGNRVIGRTGAVKKIMAALSGGRDTALLFDQNVKRNHAVFVDWFGRPAATTMTVGLAAVRCRAKIAVCSMRYLGDDMYEIDAVECSCEDIYNSDALTIDEKVFEVTKRASEAFEGMIRKSPDAWFWMHRRWKTAPEGVAEDFYRQAP